MTFKRNLMVVYDLLGEGEITLVNGLSSIYLNKTPIVNEDVKNTVQSGSFNATISGSNLTFDYGTAYSEDSYRPVRVKGAYAAALGTTTAGSNVVTANTAFFTSPMIASSTEGTGGLHQKLRIVGAGLGSTEYEGEIVQINSSTEAVVFPPVPLGVSSSAMSFDYFSWGQVTNTGIVLDAPPPIANTTMIDIGGLGSEGSFRDASTLNFKTARVSYRTGTLHQNAITNFPGFTNASYGRIINTELKQHSDYYGQKLTWGKNTATGYGTSGGTITIASGIDLPTETDRILLTITTQGLQSYKASDDTKRQTGVTLQIWFDFKTGAGNWAEELIYGPTDDQISSAKAFVWNNYENPFNGTLGDLTGNDPEASDHEFSFNIDQFKPFTQFRIRIKRITPTNYKLGSFQYTNGTVVKSVQGFIEDKLRYPYSAYCALMLDSNEHEGRLPERAYKVRGLRCEVPSNYITREESSTGIAKYTRDSSTGNDTGEYQNWDGTFRSGVYCNNPIWILRSLLLQNRFGLGNWLLAENINIYSLYTLARRCDELVPDGEGGLEPRFTCGVYITEATEAYAIIKDFCSIMFSVPFWVDGKLSIEPDTPKEPIYTFSKGNIIDGIFSYESTGAKTRPNQIAVTFNDKNNFYAPTVELVDDAEDMINRNKVYMEDAVAFGATTRSQAIRYAKWKLLTSKYNTEVISFKTGENAGILKPGDVIRIQDADRKRVRHSGRVKSATTTTVTLDKAVTLQAGAVYKLHCTIPGSAAYLSQASATINSIGYSKGDILPINTEEDAYNLVDDSDNPVVVTWSPSIHIETRTVTTAAGSNISVLGVSAAFSLAPESDFMWVLTMEVDDTPVDTGGNLYRILSIGEESTGMYSISAGLHLNEKFDELDETYLASAAGQLSYDEVVPSITNFTATLAYRNAGVNDSASSRMSMDISLRWTAPSASSINSTTVNYSNLSKYVISYYDATGELVMVEAPKTATNYIISNVLPGSYEFSIQAFNILNNSTTPIYTTLLVRDETDIPGTVNQAGLPRGGLFSVPPILEGKTIKAANDYKFTSPGGVTVEIVGGNLVP